MPKRRRGGKSKSDTKPEVKPEAKPEAKEEKPEPPPPSTPEPDDAEEDAEAAAAVEQLLATPTTPKATLCVVTPMTPTTAGLQVARTRLTGLLHRVNKSAGAADDSDSSQDDLPILQSIARVVSPVETTKRGSPAPAPVVKVKTETPSSSNTTSKQSSGKRRKRREGVVIDSAFHHTYVMKLFDRSVDLAQFNESTSLYPVCRAWMANQPRNPNLLSRRQSPSPSPSEDEEDENKSDKEENSKDSNEEEETIKPVLKLPPPSSFANPKEPMRVPSPIPHVVEPVIINQEANIEEGMDERALLAEHVGHWRAVKTKWMQAGHNNEDRYRDSIDIIEDIYKKAQEMYA